ncbi:MAG: FG-GAP-like repeat-containing protein [Syntrophobacteraceae bacterium]|jgi:hypothetical protein
MKKLSLISLWVFLITAVILTPLAEACLVSGPGCDIAGVADFNGDGSQDVLWRSRTTGEVTLWYMHENTLILEQKIEIASDRAWVIAGVGDLNEDGLSDLLMWNKPTGEVRISYLKDLEVTGQDTIARVSGTWNIAGLGDFNGDGNFDILWRNSTTGETIGLLCGCDQATSVKQLLGGDPMRGYFLKMPPMKPQREKGKSSSHWGSSAFWCRSV